MNNLFGNINSSYGKCRYIITMYCFIGLPWACNIPKMNIGTQNKTSKATTANYNFLGIVYSLSPWRQDLIDQLYTRIGELTLHGCQPKLA